MKGHFSENWADIAHREATHNSEYTILNYALEGNNASGNFGGRLPISPSGGIAGFQVQAQRWVNEPPRDPLDYWRMALAYASEWSNIQTISIPDGKITISTSSNPTLTATSTPTATTPTVTPTSIPTSPDTNDGSITLPLNTFAAVIIVIVLLIVAVLVLALKRQPKNR
jgi:hypothetical protein